jgi:hypothetical protein
VKCLNQESSKIPVEINIFPQSSRSFSIKKCVQKVKSPSDELTGHKKIKGMKKEKSTVRKCLRNAVCAKEK